MTDLHDGLPCPECGIENTHVHEDGDKMQCGGCHHLWVPDDMPAESVEIDDSEPDEFADDVDVPTTPQEHVDEARRLLDATEGELLSLMRANVHATLAVAEVLLQPTRTMDESLRKLTELFEGDALDFLRKPLTRGDLK